MTSLESFLKSSKLDVQVAPKQKPMRQEQLRSALFQTRAKVTKKKATAAIVDDIPDLTWQPYFILKHTSRFFIIII